ncbi:hypothetical protein Fleli_2925 [Bernardetia litoralis DSM 6794]|uniref:Uncharacterized protein n=1 Tax=Bernardetia litoralis (strain ATCC 23117 / DSM 6794 / NBRC 15988 / NCIMB 1366 / Fx l1 / Sio-4) TaxID=880071 RepID=I4AMT9_BERLS|nr:hypothetical protein [Bernardetia litoralis]AFM05274.1 hypothetical protein Fleli_2925 [Bernardetia litoralis DSM 6794]
MKLVKISILILVSIIVCDYALAQSESKFIYPFPKNIKTIKGIEYYILKDSIMDKKPMTEMQFDKRGNMIKNENFPNQYSEENTYDSLDRLILKKVNSEFPYKEIINYPSENQEIRNYYNSSSSYRQEKTERIVNKKGQVTTMKIHYSTFNLSDSLSQRNTVQTDYVYDRKGNITEQTMYDLPSRKITQKMFSKYRKNKLKSLILCTKDFSDNENRQTGEYLYFKKGDFKGKIKQSVFRGSGINQFDVVDYTYNNVSDSVMSITVDYTSNDYNQLEKTFYDNNKLIRIETYLKSKNDNEPSKLTSYIEYEYFFYQE